MNPLPRRLALRLAALSLPLVALLVFLSLARLSRRHHDEHPRERGRPGQLANIWSSVSWQSSAEEETYSPYVLGPPTAHFRDNLRKEYQYITSFPSQGWTNDVIAYGNLVYLARTTGRIAVLPHFVPAHVGRGAPVIPFGEVFDVGRLDWSVGGRGRGRAAGSVEDADGEGGSGVLEWRDVKQFEAAHPHSHAEDGGTAVDELGCWSLWMTTQPREGRARPSTAIRQLGLEISYTPAPLSTKLLPSAPADKSSSFAGAAALTYPSFAHARPDRSAVDAFVAVNPVGSGRARPPVGAARDAETFSGYVEDPSEPRYGDISALLLKHDGRVPPRGNPGGKARPPDMGMMCFDYTFYLSSFQRFDYDRDYSPAWNHAMRYFRFTPKLERLAAGVVGRALGVGVDYRDRGRERGHGWGSLPPFIAIHARRGDFESWCPAGVAREACLPPLEAYARRVDEMREKLRVRYRDAKSKSKAAAAKAKGEVNGKAGMAVAVDVDVDVDVETIPVVMTSDERDAGWWEGVRARGWVRLDYTAFGTGAGAGEAEAEAEERVVYGDWYPVFIDAVVQSRAAAFVGTYRSSMSLMAKRRVETWHGGPGVLVRWGAEGADDH